MDKILSRDMLIETITDLQELAGRWVKDRAERRDALVSSLKSVETRLRNLYEILELHGKDAPNLGDLTTRIRELRIQRDEAEQKLVRLEEEKMPEIIVNDYDVEAMASIMRDIVLSAADGKKLRAFFTSFIEQIYVGLDDVRIDYNRESVMNRALSGAVHSDAIWLPDRVLLRTASVTAKLPDRFIKKAA